MCPFIDPTTGVMSNAAFGVDSSSLATSNVPTEEAWSNVITKGIPTTILSAVNSFANTAIEAGNFLGADIDKLDMKNEVDPEAYDYYQQNQGIIDTAGFFAGSAIPGGAAVKALRFARAGEFTSELSAATGLLRSNTTARITSEAMNEIKLGDAALFPSIRAEQVQAIGLGYLDNALEGAVYTAATAATMKASPLLDDENWRDVASDIGFGAITGGLIGGSLDGIFTRSLFQKAMLASDQSSKWAENAAYLGKLGVDPGDRVVSLLASVEKINQTLGPPTVLQAKKVQLTNEAATDSIRKIFSDMVDKGDEDLSTAMTNLTIRAKQSGLSVRDDLSDPSQLSLSTMLTRLGKLSRIGDQPSTPNGETFFINRFAKGAERNWSDLVTDNPMPDNPNILFSQAYQLKVGATEAKIAHFEDMFQTPDGKSFVPRYSSAADAWEDGADLFMSKGKSGDFQININPKAPNIEQIPAPGFSRILTPAEATVFRRSGQLPEEAKKLFGAPLTVNTITGDITNSNPTAVVGDFGKPKVIEGGLQYGNKFSKIDQSTPTNLTTGNSLDVNARYVYFAQKGIKQGETIGDEDLPALEQLYRQASQSKDSGDYLSKFIQKGGELASGEDLPSSLRELSNHIQGVKNDTINQLIDKNPDIPMDEIALRANVPIKYIEDGMRSNNYGEFTIDPSQHQTVNHVQLEYNMNGITRTPTGQIARGLIDTHYRVQLATDAADSAAAKLFGNDADLFKSSRGSEQANILGSGSKFIAESNANYDTLAQEMERIGGQVTQFTNRLNAADAGLLTPPINAIRNDEQAAAEWGMFLAVRRRTAASFAFLPDTLADKYQLPRNTVVLNDSLKIDKKGNITDWNKDYKPEGDNFYSGELLQKGQGAPAGNYTYYTLSPKVANLERAMQQVNDNRIPHKNNFYMAQGLEGRLKTGTLYAPPIDTTRYPYFAYVRSRPGTALGNSDVAIITASSKEELQQKIGQLTGEYTAWTKDQGAEFHKAEGDYQQDLNMAQNKVNTDLHRRGILNNIYPETRAEKLIDDYLNWNGRQNLSLTRNMVELTNAKLFAELQAMGKRFVGTETSQAGWLSPFVRKTADNPYDSYIRTALAVGNKDSNYPLWAYSQEKLEQFGDTAFNGMRYAFGAARKGLISYEDASQMAEKFGMGNPYEAATDRLKNYYSLVNKLPDPQVLRKFISVANTVLGSTVIRLDTFQQLIHILATPVLLTAESNSVRSQIVKNLLTTELPDGSGRQVPAISKVIYKAIQNYWNEDVRAQYGEIYQKAGVNRDELTQHMNMIDTLRLPYGNKGKINDIVKWTKQATDIGAKYAGTNFSRNFIHFVAADTGRQLFEGAGYSGKQLFSNIQTFASRIQGNYIATQRPVAFQGILGQAVGLFQTYQFNLMQQLLRYVENGEGKTIAMMAALHSTVFGLQGLPGFSMINNHLIGNAPGNTQHNDAYSELPQAFGHTLGNWLLYGAASNVLQTGLYTRGDINPRQLTLLPVNPLDFPAISGGIRFVGSMFDAAAKIAKGGDIPASLLVGLEHNGLSRPLAGLAQLVQGYSTTASGSLIQSTSTNPPSGDNTQGYSDLLSIANFSRLFGARPLDEAIAMNAEYRSNLYKAVDVSRMEGLGEAVKSTMIGNRSPSDDETDNFITQYAAAGGDIRHFSSQMLKWGQEANASTANKFFGQLSNSGISRNMQEIMGGTPLADFRNQGSTQGTSPVSQSSDE
jgi:hypothetical protein